MGRSFYVISALTGFLAGVAACQLGWWVIPMGGFLLWFIFPPVRIFFKVWAMAVFGIFAVMGIFRVDLAQHMPDATMVDFYNGQTVTLEGVIVDVDIRRDKAKYTLKVSQIADEGAAGKLLVSTDRYPEYRYGDVIRMKGELRAPGQIDDFDYGNYLSRFDIYSVMYRPMIHRVDEGKGSLFWNLMTGARGVFMDRINQIFPEPHASFMAGLLVGARKGIPPDLMEDFNTTGLTHIIAISGFNITIIIAFMAWMLRAVPRLVGFYAAVLAITLFTLFVGASPAVTRASIMGILGLLALHYGRQSSIHLTVLWSAFFMVLWNPKTLWWDVGFQLSFAAVMGLIYVAPLFDSFTQKLPKAFAIREALQLTLAAQVMALPIIVFHFERLSLIAPLANLLVAFAIPPAMLLGFLAVIFSFVFSPLAWFFGFAGHVVLSYILKIIQLFAAVPYASVAVSGMTLFLVVLYYGLLFLLIHRITFVGFQKAS